READQQVGSGAGRGGAGSAGQTVSATPRERGEPHGELAITDPTWRKYTHFIGLTAEHVALVHELWEKFDHKAAVDRFHDEVVAQPELDAIVRAYSTSGGLKAAWTAHWETFTGGGVDDAYIQSRLKMGEAHVRVALGQAWYLAAYTWIFDMLVQA